MSNQHQKEEEARPLTGEYDYSTEDLDSVTSGVPLDRRLRRAGRQLSGCCLAVLFVLTAIVSGLIGSILAFHSIDLDKECSHHTVQFSPVLNDVDIHYGMTHFNGSFMTETVYRQDASPEVDEAWEALGVDSRASIISVAEGLESGLSEHHVQVSEKYGGGFFVNVEGMHHLHCLNLLRKGLWYNYDYYKELGTHAFANDEFIVKKHASHCLDTIRQVLMCNVDTSVLGQVWYDPNDVRAFPDFQTNHVCKNYNEVKQWAIDHQAPAPEELPEDFMKAPRSEDILPAEI